MNYDDISLKIDGTPDDKPFQWYIRELLESLIGSDVTVYVWFLGGSDAVGGHVKAVSKTVLHLKNLLYEHFIYIEQISAISCREG